MNRPVSSLSDLDFLIDVLPGLSDFRGHGERLGPLAFGRDDHAMRLKTTSSARFIKRLASQVDAGGIVHASTRTVTRPVGVLPNR